MSLPRPWASVNAGRLRPRRTAARRLATGHVLLIGILTSSHAPLVEAEHTGLVLSRRVHTRLLTVQADVAAGELDRARSRAGALLDSIGESRYDRAVVLQALVHIEIARDALASATRHALEALELGVLEPARMLDLRHKYARLLIAQGRDEEGVMQFEAWRSAGGQPEQGDWLALAQAYLALERYDRAAAALERVIRDASSPRSEWLEALFAARYRMGELDRCIEILHRLLRLEPGKAEHWRSLAAVHDEYQQPQLATATLALGYRADVLVEQSDVLRLAARYRRARAPAKAARLVEDALRRKRLETSTRAWRQVAHAWLEAREWQAARRALERAVEEGGSAEVLVELAQVVAAQRDWMVAAHYLAEALAVESESEIRAKGWLLLGTVRVHFDRAAAESAFREAARYESVASRAHVWLRFLRSISAPETRGAYEVASP